MSIKTRKIGLLGGIGPEATGEFYLRLISELQKRDLIKNNTDFPQIIINSIPAPELIDKASEEDLKIYVNGLKELESMGVDFIVMVCNTIHLYYEKISKNISRPIIDLRKEVRNYLHKNNARKIVIFGTPLTAKNGLFKFSGFEYNDLTQEDLDLLGKAIFNFNKGLDKDQQIEIVRNLAKKYLRDGTDLVILACTELGLMLNGLGVRKINTMDVMLEAVIRECFSVY